MTTKLPGVYAPDGSLYITLTDGSGSLVNVDTLPSFDTISEFTSTNVPAVNYMYVNGYYTAGDGGEASYRRVDSEPTYGALRTSDRFLPDGTVDNTNGGWWQIVGNSVNILQFGAINDGDPVAYTGTNNTPFINNALLYINSLDGGGEVIVPAGYYIVSAANSADPGAYTGGCVNVPSNCTLRGTGGWLIQSSNNQGGGQHVVLIGNLSRPTSKVKITGLNIDGNRANGNTSTGFHCIRTGGQVSDCEISYNYCKSSESFCISIQATGTYAFNNTDGNNNVEFFNSDTLWTKGTGWTISGGVASSDGTQTGTSDLSRTSVLTSGSKYAVVFDITSWTSGTVTPVVGGTLGTARSGVQTFYAEDIISAGTDFALRASEDFVGSIDNVTVMQAGAPLYCRILYNTIEDSGADGIDMHNLTMEDDTNQIIGNFIKSFNMNSTGTKGGIHVRGNNITVANNIIKGVGTALAGVSGIVVGNGERCFGRVIIGNVIDFTQSITSCNGIVVNDDQVIISANYVRLNSSGLLGISISGNDCLIKSNFVQGGSGLGGISFPSGQDTCRISGNQVENYTGPGYFIQGSNCSINGNTAKNCTTYGINIAATATGTEIKDLKSISCTSGRLNDLGVNTIDYDIISPSTAINGINFVGNPSFDIWQAGTSFTSGSRCADLWQRSTNNVMTVTQQTGFNGSLYCIRVQRNSGSTSTSSLTINQILPKELVSQLAGKTVSLSADIRCGADYSTSGTGKNVTLKFYTGTGVEEAFTNTTSSVSFPTGNVVSASTVYSVSTTTSRFTAKYTIPSNATELAIVFTNGASAGTAGTNDYFEIANVDLFIGSSARNFNPISSADILDRCLRQYRKSFQPATTPAQNVGTSTGEFLFPATSAAATTERAPGVLFSQPMRAVPTVTLYNPAASNAQVRDETAAGDCTSSASSNTTENGFFVSCTGNSSTVIGNLLGVHWTADARL